jgi:hypothetical protein
VRIIVTQLARGQSQAVDTIDPRWLAFVLYIFDLYGFFRSCQGRGREFESRFPLQIQNVAQAPLTAGRGSGRADSPTSIVESRQGSERQDRLDHRHPGGHAGGVGREGPAIGHLVGPHQLAREPQALGWQEVPLGARSGFP